MKKVIKAGLMTLIVLMVGACEVDADSPTKVAEEYCKARINEMHDDSRHRFNNGIVKGSNIVGKDGNYATVKVSIEGIYGGKGEMELKMAKEYGVWKVDKVSSASGSTSLEVAAFDPKTNFSEFKSLLEGQKKRDPELHNIGNVLKYVLISRGPDYLKLLVENGVNLNAKNSEGYTPLHIAAKEGKKDIVEYLISQKVEINPLDNDGYTPLDWTRAQCGGDTPISQSLKKAGGKHSEAWRKVCQ